MATVLEGYTTKEQHSVVLFLWAKRLSAKDVHKEMFPIYGEKCLSHEAVHNWVKKSSEGRLKVAYGALPDLPVEIMTEAVVQ
jgi:hypothetical protein